MTTDEPFSKFSGPTILAPLESSWGVTAPRLSPPYCHAELAALSDATVLPEGS